MQISPKNLLTVFMLPIGIIVLLCLFYPRPSFQLFFGDAPVELKLYNDHDAGGNSTGELIRNDSSIQFNYSIGDRLQFPYTGFGIYPQNNQTLNLESYNEIHLSIKAKKATCIPVNICINEYMLASGRKVKIILHSKLHYSPEITEYVLPISDFEIPTWWLSINKIGENEVKDFQLTNASCIEIQGGELLPQKTDDRIELRSLSFYHNPWSLIVKISTIIFGLDVLFLLIFLFRMKYRIHIQPIPYKSKEVLNTKETELVKIQKFISENYHLPITTQLLQKETGISKSKIPTLLKSELNTTLKQLLTSIRINEAKRLLLESDLPVNEIVEQVGFGHVSHFNRVFKDLENKSPLEFRKGGE